MSQDNATPNNANKILDDSFDTEIRAKEEAKGGIKYDLILVNPTSPSPAKSITPKPKPNLSATDIASKLQAAQLRKKYLEESKLNQLNENHTHLKEVLQKKQEYNNNFMEIVKAKSDQKIDSYKENREAYLKSVQEKLKDHDERVRNVRKSLDNVNAKHTAELLQKKLDIAEEIRLNKLGSRKEKLLQHDKHIEELRNQNLEKLDKKRLSMETKLEEAKKKRDKVYKELQQRLQEHEKHILDVKEANKLIEKKNEEELEKKICEKLDQATKIRLSHFQAIQNRIQEHEKHIEEVRQNKNGVKELDGGIHNLSG